MKYTDNRVAVPFKITKRPLRTICKCVLKCHTIKGDHDRRLFSISEVWKEAFQKEKKLLASAITSPTL